VPYRVALDTFGSEEVQPGKAVFDSGRLTMGFDTVSPVAQAMRSAPRERIHGGLSSRAAAGALERAFASLQEL